MLMLVNCTYCLEKLARFKVDTIVCNLDGEFLGFYPQSYCEDCYTFIKTASAIFGVSSENQAQLQPSDQPSSQEKCEACSIEIAQIQIDCKVSEFDESATEVPYLENIAVKLCNDCQEDSLSCLKITIDPSPSNSSSDTSAKDEDSSWSPQSQTPPRPFYDSDEPFISVTSISSTERMPSLPSPERAPSDEQMQLVEEPQMDEEIPYDAEFQEQTTDERDE